MKLKIGDIVFNVVKILGEGSYGKVYKVEYRGRKYALKVITNEREDGILSLRELDVMGRIRHPHLSKSYKVSSELDKNLVKYGIVMDLADMDLYTGMLIKSWNTNSRLKSLYQLTDGLDYLHSSNYLHLDLKPLNVLLFNKRNTTKLTDFGLSLLMTNGEAYYPKTLISIDHRPPEILKGGKIYKPSTDIWSLGITFLEVLSGGQSLFYDFDEEDFNSEKVLKRIKAYLSPKKIDSTLDDYLYKLKEPLKTDVKHLLKRMLKLNPNQRITTKQILNNKIFNKFKTKLGYMVNPDIPPPKYCNIANYYGFDMLVRISTNLPIKTETFFLAADIYNRALPYAESYKNVKKNFPNLVYLAMISLFIAVKMLETFRLTSEKLYELTEKKYFTPNSIIRGESFLTSQWNGIIYPKNLYNVSTTFRRLEFAFKLARKCNIYRNIDLDKWNKCNKKEAVKEGVYDKNTPFNSFLSRTQYYKELRKDPINYVKTIYEMDQK